MKIIVAALIFLSAACSVDEMNVDTKGKVPSEASNDESQTPDGDGAATDAGEDVVTTTTTTTTTTAAVAGPAKVVKERYELRNANPAVTDFIGMNYCAGSALHDCWLRSGILTVYEDGETVVSLEFWDDGEEKPYHVIKKSIDSVSAIRLTDMAKMEDDEDIPYKMLWAVVDPEKKTLAVIYDWDSDGPNEQGDDLLETVEFSPCD